MVRLTFLIILVSGAQLWMFYRQWRVMYHSLGDTKAAAEAALANAKAAQTQVDIAERALSNLEQPHVFAPDIDFIEKAEKGYTIEFVVTNFGRSPAIIREIQGQYTVRTVVPNISEPVDGPYIYWRIFEILGTSTSKE